MAEIGHFPHVKTGESYQPSVVFNVWKMGYDLNTVHNHIHESMFVMIWSDQSYQYDEKFWGN